jgi:transcriptional regulator with XRE-family HTH domain
MKQPELGKKISEHRKAKGLTQEELVEKIFLLTVRDIYITLVIPELIYFPV